MASFAALRAVARPAAMRIAAPAVARPAFRTFTTSNMSTSFPLLSWSSLPSNAIDSLTCLPL